MFKLLEEIRKKHKIRMLPGISPRRIYRAIYYPTLMPPCVIELREHENGFGIQLDTILQHPHLPSNVGSHAKLKVREEAEVSLEAMSRANILDDDRISKLRAKNGSQRDEILLYGGVCGPHFRNKFHCYGLDDAELREYFTTLCSVAKTSFRKEHLARYLSDLLSELKAR